jgi:P27 family predicted phage terminase small subunit
LRNTPATPPKRLSQEARRYWRKIVDEFQIEDETGMIILATALEAFDRMRSAQEQIRKDGMTSVDRFNQVKAHPLLTVERDARAQFLAGLRQMNLDLEPLADRPGRPPGGAKAVVRLVGDR